MHGAPAPAAAPAGARTLASVQSPPLTQIVQWMLEESNNVIAENLARHVAIATGQAAVVQRRRPPRRPSVLRRLGITGELSLYDGSGLSPDEPDRAGHPGPAGQARGQPSGAAPGPDRPAGRGLLRHAAREAAASSASAGRPGFGVVRAKTGNLATVAALAGTAYARNGQLLAFAVMADQIPAAPGALERAATAMVNMASALAGCGCR